VARKDPHAVALGKKRWTKTGDDPRVIGSLGGIAARGKSGGPRKEGPRCPCGAMTLKRALARGHKCA